ncbi:unnamed protein product [Adineta ricciae]|uniref:G-protein coupled receptors family 1 profile domain-containing protein n=1 Tax=Adineta ricciae TaxID=249248 RepID=A0A814AJN4_ADIRI|nr:unnamed protein product [Adineta ricciae]
MLEGENKTIGLILTSITFILTAFATIISLIIIVILIYQWYRKRVKQDDKITIYLCLHIYLCMLILTTIGLSMNIRTFLGDLNGQLFDSLGCIFSGYVVLIHLGKMYIAFINQAFYRFVRIVYPQYGYFLSLKFFLLLTMIEYLCISGIVCVVIPWNGVIYFIYDHFCYVSFTNLRAIIWIVLSVYALPCLCTFMIYMRITTFLRHQRNTLTLVMRQRQKRDFLIVRRILMIIIFLLTLGLPGTFFIIRYYVTGDYHPLSLRVGWMSVAISMAVLNVVLIFCIPQLRNIVRKVFQEHRIGVSTVVVRTEEIQS